MAILDALRRSGFRVEPEGDRIRIAPKTALTPEMRGILAARKGDVLRALSTEARILRMTLDRFEREGRSIQVRVPWLPETLWFVPTQEHVSRLMRRGITRGRIWTARELALLWGVPSLDRKQAKGIARIKIELKGEIVSVEGPEQIGIAEPPDA